MMLDDRRPLVGGRGDGGKSCGRSCCWIARGQHRGRSASGWRHPKDPGPAEEPSGRFDAAHRQEQVKPSISKELVSRWRGMLGSPVDRRIT
jgi:hypothetical protein